MRHQRIAFLLLDNFTMISLGCAVDPLRMANQLSGELLYEWFLITSDGNPVQCSNGIRVMPDLSINKMDSYDAVIVVAGVQVLHACHDEHIEWLKHMSKDGTLLGGVCTGSYALIKSGLMEGAQCSVHWEYLSSLRDDYPLVQFNDHVYSFDKDRMTSSGGVAPLDMMLAWVAKKHGRDLASDVSDMLVSDRMRAQHDQQKIPLYHRFGIAHPKLQSAVELMENNVEEPLDLSTLASLIGLSRRQLQRSFKKNMNCTPTYFYKKIRLNRSRQLLMQSNALVIEIVAATGFKSVSHFSTCYRLHYGVSPTEERRNMAEDTDYKKLQVPEKKLKIAPTKTSADRNASSANTALIEATKESTFGSRKISH